MKKIKLLIVSFNLSQAGSERWVYEICKNIDKKKFEVAVLCDRGYKRIEQVRNHYNYYYYELRKLNIKLYPYLEYLAHEADARKLYDKMPGKSFYLRRFVNKAINKIFYKKGYPTDLRIPNLLRSYDVVCLIDFYNYSYLEVIHHCNDKFFVVLHCHKIQFDGDVYRCFNNDYSYNFAYFCPQQIDELGESGVITERNNFFYNPLLLNLSDYPYVFNPIGSQSIVISVFTRISRMKPIDIFIKAFGKIQKQMRHKCVLNIYGEIQDEGYHQDLQQLAAKLKINKDSVRFLGHTKNIRKTLEEDKVNIYWGFSTNTNMGYASIEVCAMGIPGIFWNLVGRIDFASLFKQTNGSMVVHKEMNDFVADNLKYLADNNLLAELSVKQRDYLISRHNITDKIKDFENYVVSLSESKY